MVSSDVKINSLTTQEAGIAAILFEANCSLLLSTMNNERLVVIGALNEDQLIQKQYYLSSPNGIAISEDQMAIACKGEVRIYQQAPAGHGEGEKRKASRAWYPKLSYHTGDLDIHDLHFGKEGLWAVNTAYSCLCTIGGPYSFTPRWQPHFIDRLARQDRCHLNGLVMQEGSPLYVSALGRGNTAKSWRTDQMKEGILLHVPSNEIILSDLFFPHSPQIHDGELFMLLSGSGELAKVDVQRGDYEVVTQIGGFVRGMAKCGDYLFVAFSQHRKISSSVGKISASTRSNRAGVVLIHLPSGKIVGETDPTILANISDIYDIKLLAGSEGAEIMSTTKFNSQYHPMLRN